MKMRRGLCEFIIDGIETNIELLLKILSNEQFLNNQYNTYTLSKFIEEK